MYPAIFVGQEALVKAWAENVDDGDNGPEPVPVFSPVTDNLALPRVGLVLARRVRPVP